MDMPKYSLAVQTVASPALAACSRRGPEGRRRKNMHRKWTAQGLKPTTLACFADGSESSLGSMFKEDLEEGEGAYKTGTQDGAAGGWCTGIAVYATDTLKRPAVGPALLLYLIAFAE